MFCISVWSSSSLFLSVWQCFFLRLSNASVSSFLSGYSTNGCKARSTVSLLINLVWCPFCLLWIGLALHLVGLSICVVTIWIEFQYFLSFLIRFGYIWVGFSFGWLPESLFLTVGSVAGARQHCSFLLEPSLPRVQTKRKTIAW
jgi:hypothetical protein